MNEIAVVEKPAIEQAFELAKYAPLARGARDELDALREVRRTLLPVEEAERKRIDAKIGELDRRIQHASRSEQRLPLEVLDWRYGSGLPKLAPVPVHSAVFEISASRGRQVSSSTHRSITPLPSLMEQRFRDVQELALRHLYRPGASWSCRFEFRGLIPPEPRKRIAKALASGEFGQQVFLLCEVSEKAWVVEKDRGVGVAYLMSQYVRNRVERIGDAILSVNLDPIVVGWAHDEMWVIDKFDLTTMEQYVLDEFGVKALPSGRVANSGLHLQHSSRHASSRPD